MKNKIFKISMILVMILSLTMADFVMLGSNLISYATDNKATNHKNIEFGAYIKKEEESFLYLQINVKKEGYFNGEIKLENSNFILKDSNNSYVNKIENNTIYLNQINAGTVEAIKVRIEPIQEEKYVISLLNMVTKIKLTGIYRDSTEKDIEIQAEREVSLKLEENNTTENLQNEMKIITNKVIEINGEEKRILQLSYHMGLQENNYPIQEIKAQINLPVIDEKSADIQKVEYLNNMTTIEQEYNGAILTLSLKNEIDEAGKVNWKKQGDENVIITCLYDAEVQIENMEITINEEVTLYNNKKLKAENRITVGEGEIDNIVEVATKNAEETIYKGKINAGIDRNYASVTQVKINFAQATPSIEIVEKNAFAIYRRTIIKKEQLNQLFGQEGMITVYDLNGEVIETITNETEADEKGNIIIDYEREDIEGIKIQATAPIEEGSLIFYHSKTIRSAEMNEKIEEINELKTKVRVNGKETESNIKLENAETKATLEINKESLSTMIGNDVEIRVVFVSNDEKYELYKNPEIAIQLPEDVENIKINSMDLLYENELEISKYVVEGNIIRIALEGEQTQYKEAVEGATIVIHANLTINQKATTKDEVINMVYKNEEIGMTSKEIQIVAPVDVIPVYSVQDLGIETIGQEESAQVLMERGAEEKELEAKIEVINNKENTIENVKILGDFPTNHSDNNMGIEIIKGIELDGIENAKIYYSENEKATNDLENAENSWSETIEDANQVSKYLIVLERLEVGDSIQDSYTYKVPNNLVYNETAKTSYQVTYTESNHRQTSQANSTEIEMQTGVGPQLETKLTATVGGREITGTVKNGEVIKYKIEVANTGTEDVSNIVVKGQVPEGTTMVVEEEEYEYDQKAYYKEVEDKIYQATIEKLKVGEVISYEYEVRVNSDITNATTLINTGEIRYLDVIKQTNEVTNITETGDLRVSIKRATDRRTSLYVGSVVSYFVMVENISNEKQENVKINLFLSEGAEGGKCFLYDSNFSETIDYQEQMEIETIEAGQTKMIECSIWIKERNEENINTFFATVTDKEKEYRSNKWEDNIKYLEVEMKMTAKPTTQYVKTEDIITYEITISNTTPFKITQLLLQDNVPNQLSVLKIMQNGKEMETEIEGNSLTIFVDIEENASTIVQIEAIVNYSEAREKPEIITNKAYIEYLGNNIATAEITHIIEANKEENNPNNPDNPDNPDPDNPDKPDDNKVDNNDVAKGKKMISGIAWYDENENGRKDPEEITLSGIKVRLLNAETNHLVKKENGEVLETATNGNGIYILDKIGNGKYIAIFEYDNTQYDLTKYKVVGVEETENSNVIWNELQIEDEKKKVPATDVLEIKDEHISNINIGLKKKKNFDLKLEKTINRILIQDAKGTTVREYNNATMAKIELDAKTINNAIITVEYKIKVTNQGEVEGYAKKISDYVSKEFEFNAEINKQWNQTGDILSTTALANEKILPGESRTISLTLSKTMTENNTGLIVNTAEITEDYNELGIVDSNSIPGNRAKEENDFGLAEIVLSIKTGGIMYVTIGIITIAVLAIIAVIIMKKKHRKNQ